MRHLIPDLDASAIRHIVACRLRHLLYMPKIKMNRGLLTALVKRWHSDLNAFHLLTEEISVTFEDVYKILHIPVISKLVQYDHHEMGGIASLQRFFGDETIDGS